MNALPAPDLTQLLALAAAPMQAAIAECSDSTLMYRAASRPSAHISDSSSTTWVWGVMGYAETTSTRARRAPHETA